MARKAVKGRKARPSGKSKRKGGAAAARPDGIGTVLVNVGTLLVQLGALLQSGRPAARPGKTNPRRQQAIRDVLDSLRVAAANCDPDPTCTVECGSGSAD